MLVLYYRYPNESCFENYHNPCGLKTNVGGEDTDPSAHERFDSWDEGI
ncbi:hypothetical protein [Clostridium sp. DL-VIII]|nr:hypothetical protein [Clostridium sp. DL-VIII]